MYFSKHSLNVYESFSYQTAIVIQFTFIFRMFPTMQIILVGKMGDCVMMAL